MLLQLVAALLTAAVGWLTWYAYGVYQKGQLLSGMPGPPRRPGLLNFVLGNIPDLAGSQNHFVQKQWSRQYGGIMKLRALDTYVSNIKWAQFLDWHLMLALTKHAGSCCRLQWLQTHLLPANC